MVKERLSKMFKALHPGDLVCVDWCDASVGKSSGSGTSIDVPVKSWGVYVGLFGNKAKHIVLVQNSFKYSDGIYDLDYTAVPVSWTLNVTVVTKDHLPAEVAQTLVNSFILGGHRALHKRSVQRKVNNHRCV